MSKTEEEKINLTDIIQNNSMSTLISITKAKERNPSAGNTHDHRHSYIICSTSDWLKKRQVIPPTNPGWDNTF